MRMLSESLCNISKRQLLLFGIDQIQRSGIGIGNLLGSIQDIFQQSIDIALAGQGSTNGIEIAQAISRFSSMVRCACSCAI